GGRRSGGAPADPAPPGAAAAWPVGGGTGGVNPGRAPRRCPGARPATLAVTVDGDTPLGVTAKDIVLAIINRLGTAGGIGSVIEYRGSAIRGLSMEGRMTVCNMSIEAGARAGSGAAGGPTVSRFEG